MAGVLLAGGSSERLGTDKIWADLGGQPLIAWSLRAFADAGVVDALIVVARRETVARTRKLLESLDLCGIVVVGGAQRQDSVRAGLEAGGAADWVIVHDGARPLVTPELIQRGLSAAAETGAAIAAVPVVDTIKRVEHDTVVETLDRTSLWEAQTPQIFRTSLLRAAHARSPRGEGSSPGATDDAVLVEALGVRVRVYPGAYGNIKVTNAVDLRLAAQLLAAQNGATTGAPAGVRGKPR